MNLVVISDDDDVTSFADDVVQLDIFPENEEEVYVSLEGIPGPPGPPGPQGATGSIGDVDAVAPLYYSPAQNTIYLDVAVFDVAGAAAAALAAAQVYAENLVVNKPSKYVHSQISSSASWHIVHNLNTHPSVTIVDSSGQEVFGDIYYDSLNDLHANFSVPFSGRADLV